MQTITEKEVNAGLTQASDAAFINAFTADGTPIKISKADLASVVADTMHYKLMSIDIEPGGNITLDRTGYTVILLFNSSSGFKYVGFGADKIFQKGSAFTIEAVSEYQVKITSHRSVVSTLGLIIIGG